ncbi:HD domain-containing protein [Nocardioides insulae]|uniref:HD domain-containing protein n=1 Tax=Nocardioides insulae TaxID=394734 RepID=UPI000566712F|nr:hypothetical protein [Nocardioides insulae]
MDLPHQWPLPDSPDLGEDLVAAYTDPTRHYHDLRHLTEVLTQLDELAAAGELFPDLPVTLAAWFHDAVYDGERDAEERSAVWAEEALRGLVPDDVVTEVVRLVRLTETHDPADDDPAGRALSDADLAILAADEARYAEYAAAVRAEYAHLSDEDFRIGRTQVLETLLDKERLFRTEYAYRRWEVAARTNVRRELAGWHASV